MSSYVVEKCVDICIVANFVSRALFVDRNIKIISIKGGFRISSRGCQRYLQGVAKISQGVAKKLRVTPFSQRFLLFYTTLLIYAHLF